MKWLSFSEWTSLSWSKEAYMINPIDRRIYFGTDYDNQRNGEVFKIASNNDM
jgi:hypothetical protein